MKFRKKPVVIEAVQFTLEAAYGKMEFEGFHVWFDDEKQPYLIIKTLEGDHLCRLDDWIITGVKGERYPCKPEIFEATYEPVAITLEKEMGK